MKYVSQARMYDRTILCFLERTRDELETIRALGDEAESEIVLRYETMEGLLLLLGNDAAALHRSWREDYKEEQEREFATD